MQIEDHFWAQSAVSCVCFSLRKTVILSNNYQITPGKRIVHELYMHSYVRIIRLDLIDLNQICVAILWLFYQCFNHLYIYGFTEKMSSSLVLWITRLFSKT